MAEPLRLVELLGAISVATDLGTVRFVLSLGTNAGGIGSVLELMMVWQLLQVRHLEGVPLVFVGRMWPGLVEWARASMLQADTPLASPEDFRIPHCVADADEAAAIVRGHRERWLANPAHAAV